MEKLRMLNEMNCTFPGTSVDRISPAICNCSAGYFLDGVSSMKEPIKNYLDNYL
jgi:mannitol-1-phosphate/altronate dehydrogenase